MKFFDQTWSNISNIHGTSIVKSIYAWLFIVPVLVKALSEVPTDVSFIIAGQTIPIKMELPFSFLCFYLSAFFFVLSNIIYQLICPQLIKDHSSWRSFAEHGKGMAHLEKYVSGLKISADIKESAWAVMPTNRPGGQMQDQFWAFHDLGEKQTPWFRKAAVGFTYLAFALMAVVILQNLHVVVSYTFVHNPIH